MEVVSHAGGGRWEQVRAEVALDGAVVEGFTAGGFVYVAAATMRGLGDGNGREGATVAAIFVGTFTCAAIHALGGCDHGH